MLPELPDATFDVWVRGYGLVDSEPVAGRPDQELDLTAVVAATPQEAAQVYPSTYWLSLINLPAAHEFPGTGPEGNGINPLMGSQAEWINNLKGCQRCHQVGNKRTREIPDLDDFDSAHSAWADRVQRGQRGSLMNSFITRFGPRRGPRHAGRLDGPYRRRRGAPRAPPRPQGIERNVVLTMWNWGDNVAFVHDEIATDKRKPASQCERPALWRGHRQRLPAGDRHYRAQLEDDQDPAARERPAGAVDVPRPRASSRGATSGPRRSGTIPPTPTTR